MARAIGCRSAGPRRGSPRGAGSWGPPTTGDGPQMSYTLVGAPALGFDLVRTPSGPNVAEVVLIALSADGSTMQALANAHPGSCRPACWERAGAAAATLPRMSTVLRAMPT